MESVQEIRAAAAEEKPGDRESELWEAQLVAGRSAAAVGLSVNTGNPLLEKRQVSKAKILNAEKR